MPHHFEATSGPWRIRLDGWDTPRAWLRPLEARRWDPWWPHCALDEWLAGRGQRCVPTGVAAAPDAGAPAIAPTVIVALPTHPEPSPAIDPFREFALRVPGDLRDAIGRLPLRQFHALRLSADVPAAIDLLHGNVCLAFMLTDVDIFLPRPFRPAGARAARNRSTVFAHSDPRIADLVRRPQREALECLGFPRHGTLTVVRKVVPQALTLSRCRALRATLGGPHARKRLAHLPRINAGVLELFAAGLDGHIAGGLIREVAERTEEDRQAVLAPLVGDTLNLARLLGRDVLGLVFHSAARVQEVHDELLEMWDARQREAARARAAGAAPAGGRTGAERATDPARRAAAAERFPAFPFAGNEAIIPLDTPALLREEARVMRHCVATYAPLLRRRRGRRILVYRVLAPERATLALCLRSADWEIQQLLGAANRPVGAETWSAVREWLAAQRFAVGGRGHGGNGPQGN